MKFKADSDMDALDEADPDMQRHRRPCCCSCTHGCGGVICCSNCSQHLKPAMVSLAMAVNHLSMRFKRARARIPFVSWFVTHGLDMISGVLFVSDIVRTRAVPD